MKRTTILAFLALAAFLAAPARATWNFADGTDASSANPVVSNGAWTVTLNSKAKVKYNRHDDTSVGLLDLTDVEADTGLVITTVDYQGFNGKTDITGIVLPESCTTIGQDAFNGASKLETVVLSSQTGDFSATRSFGSCAAIKSITYTGVAAEEGVIRLPSTVTWLRNSTFQMWNGNSTITKIVAPGVTKIGKYSIYKIYNLASVEFSPNFAGFDSEGGDYAFQESGKNGSFTLSPSVWQSPVNLSGNDIFFNSKVSGELDFSAGTFTEVPYRCFCNVNTLTKLTFPATVTSIKLQALNSMKKGLVVRFLGDVPTLDGGDQSSIYKSDVWGNNGRYQIVVDANAYPNWLLSENGYTALTDADRALADYPGEDTIGYTSFTSAASNNSQKHWLVQYVDRTPYAVTWLDDDGATVLGTTVVTNNFYATWPGATPTKASTPQYDYTFDHWTPATNAAPVTAASSFQAVWSATTRSYTVTWQMDDGTTIDTTSVLYGAVPTHAAASKASTAECSYEFKGWSTNGTDVLAAPLPVVTGPTTFTAVFEQHDASTTATVSWFDEDGTTALDPATTTVTKGAQPTHEEPTKASTVDTVYTFAGWVEVGSDGSVTNVTANLPAVTDDIAYMAAFTSAVRRYTVTFANWDGTTISAIAYDYGTASNAIAIPADPTRAATAEYTYTFAGWDAAVSNVVGAATYTATYTETANTYTATFVNGQTSETISTATFAYGEDVTAPEPPEMTGYHFTEWSSAIGTMPAANTTYTAAYAINTYTITWVNGVTGATIETTTVNHGDTPTHADASQGSSSKASYAFTGWSPAIEAATSNTTYTAQFQATILSPMVLLYDGAEVAADVSGATVSAHLSNYTTTAEGFSAGVPAVVRSQTQVVGDAAGTATFAAPNVTATFTRLEAAKGYEWTLAATQTVAAAGLVDVATLHGRFWAKPPKTWFTAEQAVFDEDGAFRPTVPSGSGQQVRLHATMTFPAIPSRVHPDATGAVTGIDVYQPNAGRPLAYYAWNGAEWVRLCGAVAKLGEPVEILGVIDFAVSGGAMTWYADGVELTDEDGEWSIPMSLSRKQIASFLFDSETATLDSLAGDYDLGFNGTLLLIR